MEIPLGVLFLFLNACNASARYIQSDENSGNLSPLPGYNPDQVIVGYDNAQGRSAVQAAASKVHVDLPNYNAVAATIPMQSLNGLRKNKNIEYIEIDAPRYSLGNSKNFLRWIHHGHDVGVDQIQRHIAKTTPYGIDMVQANQVSDQGGKMICIIDSGYSRDHPDLPHSGLVTGQGLDWDKDMYSHGMSNLHPIHLFDEL